MGAKTYKNLGHRIAAGWGETIPDFVPSDELGAPRESQEQFHAFLRRTAGTVADQPELIGMAEFPDGAYRLGELQNRRPELISAMRKLKRKLDDFVEVLYGIGRYGKLEGQCLTVPKSALALGGRTAERLSRIGLIVEKRGTESCVACPGFPAICAAWTALARDAASGAAGDGSDGNRGDNPVGVQRDGSGSSPVCGKSDGPERSTAGVQNGGQAKGPAHVSPVRFSRAMFRRAYPYSRDMLLRLAGTESGLGILVEYMEAQGYSLVCDRDNRLTADWIKSYDPRGGSAPLKDSWAERCRGGLSLEYDWIRAEPVLIGLRIPEFPKLLRQYDKMDENLRSFVVGRTKKCNACGYCTQTDRTGKRQPSFIAVESDDGPKNLCTLFPGFSYTWSRIDSETGRSIEDFLGFADRVLTASD